MIREMEAALESALCDPAMDEAAVVLTVLFTDTARDGEHVLLDFHGEVFLTEAGDSEFDQILVFVDVLDVVRGVALGFDLGGGIHHVRKAVKAHDRTVERGEINSTHGQSILS